MTPCAQKRKPREPFNPAALTFNVTNAAKVMGMSRKELYELMAAAGARRLAYIPMGTDLRHGRRVSRAEIDRWIRDNTVRTPDELRAALDGRRQS